MRDDESRDQIIALLIVALVTGVTWLIVGLAIGRMMSC